MKNKIECSYAITMFPRIDYGQFIAEKGGGGKIKVSTDLYYRYIEARRQFEILNDEMYRELPIKVKRQLIEMCQKGSPSPDKVTEDSK